MDQRPRRLKPRPCIICGAPTLDRAGQYKHPRCSEWRCESGAAGNDSHVVTLANSAQDGGGSELRLRRRRTSLPLDTLAQPWRQPMASLGGSDLIVPSMG